MPEGAVDCCTALIPAVRMFLGLVLCSGESLKLSVAENICYTYGHASMNNTVRGQTRGSVTGSNCFCDRHAPSHVS